ncbi:hypothetical protein OBBRIDRAFT_664113 [Obba rivulosa]|uniref:Uncharacterized protein n=1 Tax=Obba rivulosa TaxID=1052685 RepID=A0A8E2AW92_9APHY|nr:hypothetical protein OBBRIDRAFT_664113 [Obba rivulosa]
MYGYGCNSRYYVPWLFASLDWIVCAAVLRLRTVWSVCTWCRMKAVSTWTAIAHIMASQDESCF